MRWKAEGFERHKITAFKSGVRQDSAAMVCDHDVILITKRDHIIMYRKTQYDAQVAVG